MNKILLIIQILLCSLLCIAQRNADAIFYGGCSGDPACWCSPPFQGNVFWFNDDSLHQIIDPSCLPIRRYLSGASFSDNNTGELLFASNGWRLINGQGDILTHKLWFDDIPHPGGTSDTTTVNVIAGPLFLNHPQDTNKVYLFYGQQSSLFVQMGYSMVADIYFTYALLDIPSRSLISKNTIILSDTSSVGDMQACRHANGRDWWIVKPHMYTDLYYVGLLAPSGVSMNLVQLPGVPHLLRTNTSSKFNILGNKYIQYTGQPHQQVQEYDFDRCSGLLSNLLVHDINDSIADNDILSAISISPDGSKFYFKRNTSFNIIGGFYQLDLNNNEINLITGRGQTPQMMPNGKKMLFGDSFQDANNQIQRRVSEIANPNAPFNELQIEQFKYNTPNAMLSIAPSNFAYFRLGPEVGSACDTLGLVTNGEEINNNLEYLTVFPNPSRDKLNIKFIQNKNEPVQFFIFNTLGQQVYENILQSELTSVDAISLGIASGVYTVHVQSGKQRLVRKWVLGY